MTNEFEKLYSEVKQVQFLVNSCQASLNEIQEEEKQLMKTISKIQESNKNGKSLEEQLSETKQFYITKKPIKVDYYNLVCDQKCYKVCHQNCWTQYWGSGFKFMCAESDWKNCKICFCPMKNHQHATIEYEEEKKETVEYKSLKEAIEQKNKGVKLVDAHQQQLDKLKKEMQERCKNLIKAISRQKELGVGKDYIRSLQTCISYINQRLEVCELGSEEEDYLKKSLKMSQQDL